MKPAPKITFITCLWQPANGWAETYDYNANKVCALYRMLSRNLSIPFNFVLHTDKPYEWAMYINPDNFSVRPIWVNPVTNPRDKYPNCWRRLPLFKDDISTSYGTDYICLMDLDTVIMSDFSDEIERVIASGETFVIRRGETCPYNGSFWILKAGEHHHIFYEFNPEKSPEFLRTCTYGEDRKGRPKPMYGSDQAWISFQLMSHGHTPRTLWKEDGFYSYRLAVLREGYTDRWPTPTIKIMSFEGRLKPWDAKICNSPVGRHIFEYYKSLSEGTAL